MWKAGGVISLMVSQLHEYEICSVILKEEHKLQVFRI
jgi:hypothetical protein